jgi:hypothetical protein
MCEEIESVITKLTVAFRLRMFLTTMVIFGYNALQYLYSEVYQNFGVAELLGRRDVYG